MANVLFFLTETVGESHQYFFLYFQLNETMRVCTRLQGIYAKSKEEKDSKTNVLVGNLNWHESSKETGLFVNPEKINLFMGLVFLLQARETKQ